MAFLTFHLLSLSKPAEDFLTFLCALPKQSSPLYVGKTRLWIHEPGLSIAALTGSSATLKACDFLVVAPSNGTDGLALPEGVDTSSTDHKWSIASPVDDTFIEGHHTQHIRRLTSTPPIPPPGWSAEDHSGLEASEPPADLSAHLGLRSRPLGQKDPVMLKDFIASFGTEHAGPVAMFNLLSYMPDGGREQYFRYVQAFQASTGIKYGGEPLFPGRDVSDWSSKADASERGQEGGWKDCALIWYPSLWHFREMLDDPGYAEADRKFKQGAIRDNPLICCTEVDAGYVE